MPLAVRLCVLAAFTLFYCLGGPAAATKRAFVVGISDYVPEGFDLPSSWPDANRVARELRHLNYVTKLVEQENTTLVSFFEAWRGFLNKVGPGDDVVFYFSGHGVAVQSVNFLVPRDADPNKISSTTNPLDVFVSFDQLMVALQKKRPNAAVWILDACRDNELKLGLPKGLFTRPPPSGNMVIFAASNGHAAIDHRKKDPKTTNKSVFGRVFVPLIHSMSTKSITAVTDALAERVPKAALPEIQHPESLNFLTTLWCFAECEEVPKIAVEGAVVLKAVSQHLTSQNVVYMGKKPAAGDWDCEKAPPDTHPFGCAVLKAIFAKQTSEYVGKTLELKSDVNLWQDLPIVLSTNKLKFSCRVERLKAGVDEVPIEGVFKLISSDQELYYGAVKDRYKQCQQDGGVTPHG